MSLAAGGAATGIGLAGATDIVVGPGIFMFASGAGIVVGLLDPELLQPTMLRLPRQATSNFFVEHRISDSFKVDSGKRVGRRN
jgi:hypothetical protein